MQFDGRNVSSTKSNKAPNEKHPLIDKFMNLRSHPAYIVQTSADLLGAQSVKKLAHLMTNRAIQHVIGYENYLVSFSFSIF